MSWYTYILLCNDKSYYIGITNDLKKRLILHNTGKGLKYLLSKLPVKLLYYEEYPNKSEAHKREIQLKGWTRIKKEKLIKGLLKKLPKEKN
jgi:putative endonuclease